jgi:hypothetical protein
MKTLFLLLFTAASVSAQTPIFNGKNLDGWNIRKGEEKWWRAEDGMIVGGSLTETVPHNTFLSTTKVYQNFEITLKIKLNPVVPTMLKS